MYVLWTLQVAPPPICTRRENVHRHAVSVIVCMPQDVLYDTIQIV